VFNRSISRGQLVANTIFEWSATDGAGHNAYLDPRPSAYIPPVGPGLWQPTFPDFTPGLFPYWGQVRTFALRTGDKVARQPVAYSEDSNSLFYLQAKETYIEVNDISRNYEKEWIALFWSDDIFELTFEPAARWVAIANQVVDKEKPNLSKAAELYAKIGMSLCDAGIAIWNSKYHYNIERPVSYIRRVMNPNWITILNNPIANVTGMTPEFPAYPSGHSGFGSAAAGILIDMFGFNYTLTDRCHEFRNEFIGTPRTFYSFADMAYENALSRIYLGVHYRMDCEEGLRLGYLAADRVNKLPWKR
jgi:membrane-associated phospholipid phosphatase